LFNSLIIILSLIICINCNNKNSPNKLRAEKGVIDLRNWDFEKYGNVDLEGEWEFYWNEFPEILGREISEDFQFSKKPNYIPVPFEWQNFEVEGKKLPVDGFATYRLKILLPNENRDLKIYMTDVCSAFEFYINKKLHFKRGKIGKIKEENEPSLRYGTFEIQKDDSRELEIYLLISNFHHAKGGFWNKPTLGVSKNIDSFKDTVLSIGYISFGGLFIMGVYHLFLYLLRTKDRSPLYFGIFCILMALRIVSMNERVLMDFFPFLSFLHFYKMEYFTLYGSLPFYLLFIKSLFPDEFLVINTKIINSIAIVGNLIVLFGSPKIYTTWLLLIFQLLILYAII
ncbi:MAG: 7TM-DISM domain-containing protein, partial [Leptospiraceae bacterium]|nr:7TM-DISM domain-containing protein [Leptospiraceae bacterium]